MDALRGAAIILVVLFHASTLAQQVSDHQLFRLTAVVVVFGELRMPLLFCLSGMLIPRSLMKGVGRYITRKMRGILYPYVLWSVVTIGVFDLIAIVGGSGWFPNPWWILYQPIEHMWFLAYLFLYAMIALLTRWVNPVIIVLIALVLTSIPIGVDWSRFWDNAVPFFIGVLIAQHWNIFLSATSSFWRGGALLTAAVAVAALSQFGLLNLPRNGWGFPLFLTFIVGATAVFRPISDRALLAPLRFLGTHSIMFYVSHVPAMLLTRLVMRQWGITSPWLLVASLILVSLITGAAFSIGADRYRPMRWLFEWPAVGREKRTNPATTKQALES